MSSKNAARALPPSSSTRVQRPEHRTLPLGLAFQLLPSWFSLMSSAEPFSSKGTGFAA